MNKIILASSSPRRRELLTLSGITFEVVKPDVPEVLKKGEKPEAYVRRLSLEKALALLPSQKVIVIAADTIVVDSKKKILEKPVDVAHAMQMLTRISGKKHTVFTGYVILNRSADGKILKEISRVVKTEVTIRKLSKQLIHDYIGTGEPMDKAGAYAAQGHGMVLIEAIKGSYTNVVGLPMGELLTDLEKSFKVVPQWQKSKPLTSI